MVITSRGNDSMISPRTRGNVSLVSIDEEIDQHHPIHDIDDNFRLDNRLETVSEDKEKTQYQSLFHSLCYYTVHLANICSKAFYLKFTPKICKEVFQGMLFTSSVPYLAVMTSALFCGRPCYYKSNIIVLINCAQFTLELANNILIG